MLPIAIGADDAAIELKNAIIAYLSQREIPFLDFTAERAAGGKFTRTSPIRSHRPSKPKSTCVVFCCVEQALA